MKKTALSLLCLVTTTLLTYADITIVQRVEGAGQNGETTMQIKGDKMRVDVQDSMSVIMDTKSGDMMTLMHEQKALMEMKGAVMQQMMEAATAQIKTDESSKPVATGKKETIDGRETEIYTSTVKVGNENIETTYWIAKDFPNGDKLREAMKSIENSALGTMMKNTPKTSDLPGVPVKSVAKVPSMGDITTTLVSVKEGDIAATVFEKPEGYQALQMPQLPQAPAGN